MEKGGVGDDGKMENRLNVRIVTILTQFRIPIGI